MYHIITTGCDEVTLKSSRLGDTKTKSDNSFVRSYLVDYEQDMINGMIGLMLQLTVHSSIALITQFTNHFRIKYLQR